MVNSSKGVNPSRLIGTFGSKHLNSGTAHTAVNAYAFIAQEDTIMTVLKGGDANLTTPSGAAISTDNYLTSMSLGSVTLKQGALIQAPSGELFQAITMTSGAIIAYK